MARSILSFQTLFGIFGLIVPSVIVLAPKGAVPILALLALALAASWAIDRRALTWPDLASVTCLGLLVAWAAIAPAWGYQPGPSLVPAIGVAAVVAAGFWVLACAISLSPSERQKTAAVAFELCRPGRDRGRTSGGG